jgi:hypothetical protein
MTYNLLVPQSGLRFIEEELGFVPVIHEWRAASLIQMRQPRKTSRPAHSYLRSSEAAMDTMKLATAAKRAKLGAYVSWPRRVRLEHPIVIYRTFIESMI